MSSKMFDQLFAEIGGVDIKNRFLQGSFSCVEVLARRRLSYCNNIAKSLQEEGAVLAMTRLISYL